MLADFKKWSDTHPEHLPIYILIESKEETIGDKTNLFHFAKSIPFTPDICNDMDTEIKSDFGDSLSQIITQDRVRGNFNTLNEAVLANNWPTVGASRGKFIIVLMGPAIPGYIKDHPSLKGRAMFTFSDIYTPESAIIKYESPVTEQKLITEAVAKGYIVRTRADEPNHQNRTCDFSQMNAAFNSGAQIISTDYYRPDPRYKKKPKKFKNYCCKFPFNELARVNPVNGPSQQLLGKIGE
jgi:hypothetical protein